MGEVQKIKTNVRLLVENWKDQEGFVTYAQLHPRSSLRAKGISMLGTGVVDLDYTGEIILLVTNHCEINVRINTGDRVGQLIFCQALRPNGIPISEAIRVGGLGSTGS
jgi:dUTP pyrophosphatase